MPASIDFKNQSVEDLKAAYLDLSRQIFLLKNELAVEHRLEKPHHLKEAKKNRARALTALREKVGSREIA
jgi:ribosomal protein L29